MTIWVRVVPPLHIGILLPNTTTLCTSYLPAHLWTPAGHKGGHITLWDYKEKLFDHEIIMQILNEECQLAINT